MPHWLLRTILGVVAAVVLVVGYLIASVTVPLVWANAIRDQVGGQLGNSIPLGMFYGFIFTFVPVLLVWQARRKKLNKWVRISLAGSGPAAHHSESAHPGVSCTGARELPPTPGPSGPPAPTGLAPGASSSWCWAW